MSSVHFYYWTQNDTIWIVAATLLGAAGYMDTPTFVTAIQASNGWILDWQAVPTGTLIVIPYLTS